MYSTGLATVVGETLAGSLGAGAGAWTVDLLAAATAILISETTSNTASVGIIVPIIPALAASAGIDPVTPALIAVFAATYGFMLPISTSANAIAYSSGAIPIRAMIRCGFLVDLSGILIIVVGTRLMVHFIGVA